jgi:hypothetical protein
MSAEIGGIGRHDDEMPEAGSDVLLAPGADVGLEGLERVDAANLHRPVQRGINAHSNSPAMTATAAATMT